MKDLEKIKSEDLGCQVADANPGNFAIEQEVAQLVGATVPAPTEPSADDARELGAQLLVFLRRALTPIQTALRTAVAAIYAHLDSRCTDYTPAAYDPFRLPAGPYDPMRPFVPRTLPNLLTALTAFSARKISGVPEAADGISLVHITHSAQTITELTDDNRGWVMDRVFESSKYPSIKKLEIGAGTTSLTGIFKIVNGLQDLEEVTLHFKEITSRVPSSGSYYWQGGIVTNCPKVKKINMPDAEKIDMVRTYGGETMLLFAWNPLLEEVNMPIVKRIEGNGTYIPSYPYYVYMFDGCPNIKKLVFGTVERWDPNCLLYSMQEGSGGSQEQFQYLVHLEFGEGTAINLDLRYWNPTDKGTTFLQNFREHIALRLTANGTGLTLTLSQAVFDTIWNQDGTPKSTDPDSVIYQINKIIKTDKHWSVNRA